MTDKPYSFNLARRNLYHFAIGRVLVGLTGIALLVLTVRCLAPIDFGSYVALIAMIDIVGFASSLGLFGFVQRYIPEYRIHGTARQFGRVVLLSLAYRFLTLLPVVAVLAFAAVEFCRLAGLPIAEETFRLFCLVLVLDCSLRFIDQMFESLLMQAASQIASFARSVVKLVGLLALAGYQDWQLRDVLFADALAASLALLLAAYLFWHNWQRLQLPSQKARSFDRKLMAKVSIISYLALLASQAYGFDALKLLVSKLAGVTATAAYGFAQSIADIVRRYLPAYLLLGMIRPLIVASFSKSNDHRQPLMIANLVLKLNAFLIAPLLAATLAVGAPLLDVLAKGRYPEAHEYVVVFLVLLLMQTWHTMLSLLAMTLERNDLVMKGTWGALAGTATAILLIPAMGARGALAAAFVSELAYCLVVSRGLYNALGQPAVNWAQFKTLGAISAIACATAWLIAPTVPDTPVMQTVAALLIGVAYLVIAMIWKPFSIAERETINRFLPRPLFCW